MTKSSPVYFSDETRKRILESGKPHKRKLSPHVEWIVEDFLNKEDKKKAK